MDAEDIRRAFVEAYQQSIDLAFDLKEGKEFDLREMEAMIEALELTATHLRDVVAASRARGK
jgi:hypothetical protein